MKNRHHVEKLAKRLAAVLGRNPDELGLVLDQNGFVGIKDLLQALNEEDGWRHIRRHDLAEVVYSLAPCPVEMDENQIRATNRDQLITPKPPEKNNLPKLAWYAVRRRRYPVVLERGMEPAAATGIVLSREPEMALRIGRRRDSDPVMLTVNLSHLIRYNVTLQCYGNLLLADQLPVGTFTGPVLRTRDDLSAKSQRAPEVRPLPPVHAGSYFPDLSPKAPWEKKTEKHPEREKNQWKSERRRKQQKRSGKWPSARSDIESDI
ncbi:RNA 2'-phosphotransferase [Desulfosarcina sp. OttesenSCG-928-A07]|nr:RNA 2'-phosphotransferase [Desulfosarcina sp. OttesenSCG-928-G17]MDL2328589.1 RNA 2'-phosphotransferase [Desulfosarcina sp. OttesenSCG-928-A07]